METLDTDKNKDKKIIELNEEDKQNIKIIMDKHNLDEETTKKIYLAFNKNIIAVLKYISTEIDNIKIICNQTGIEIEDARDVYYKCNKDIIDSIEYILEGNQEEDNKEDNKEDEIVKEEKIPLFNEDKNYRHIIEYGKDLLYDEENDFLFDAETKEFFSTMKSAKTKISELRYIVDAKDTVIQSQKKTIKKEKIEEILEKYQQKLLEWGESQLKKWEDDEKLKNKYPNKDDYKNHLETQIKLQFANETSKYH